MILDVTIRTLVAEADEETQRRMRRLVDENVGFAVVGACASAEDVVAAVERDGPDLVVLDLALEAGVGDDLVEALGARDQIDLTILTSADARHAVRAFELGALDYIEKPFEDDRFRESLRRARARFEVRRLRGLVDVGTARRAVTGADGAEERGFVRRLVVKRGPRSILVPVDDIDWIEAANYYAAVHVGDDVHVVDETLARLEEILDPGRFVRIHRSTIVNLDRVTVFERMFHGDFAVLLEDGTSLKLSRTYRSNVEEMLSRSL